MFVEGKLGEVNTFWGNSGNIYNLLEIGGICNMHHWPRRDGRSNCFLSCLRGNRTKILGLAPEVTSINF